MHVDTARYLDMLVNYQHALHILEQRFGVYLGMDHTHHVFGATNLLWIMRNAHHNFARIAQIAHMSPATYIPQRAQLVDEVGGLCSVLRMLGESVEKAMPADQGPRAHVRRKALKELDIVSTLDLFLTFGLVDMNGVLLPREVAHAQLYFAKYHLMWFAVLRN